MIARDEKQSSGAAEATAAAATAPSATPEAAAPSAPAAPAVAAPAAAAPAAPAAAAPAAPAAAPGLSTKITAGPGGVMTDEVGVITGELTLQTEVSGGKVTLKVQYFEADEWYTVTGGKTTVKEPADAEAVHKVAVGLLDRPEG